MLLKYYIHICKHMYIYLYMCICTYICICIYVYIFVHTHKFWKRHAKGALYRYVFIDFIVYFWQFFCFVYFDLILLCT